MPDDGDGADERRQSRGGGSTARSVYMLRNRTGVFSELEDSKGRKWLGVHEHPSCFLPASSPQRGNKMHRRKGM